MADPIRVVQYSQGARDDRMGGQCALLKVQSTVTFEFCAREASQIFGGSSVVREGKGRVVERLYREVAVFCLNHLPIHEPTINRNCALLQVRTLAIPGGSEEILRELAIKDAIKSAMTARM